MKISEINPTKRFFGLFIGDSGHGKTCAAVSFPTPGLVIDIDHRIDGALESQRWLPPNKLSEWEVIQCKLTEGFAEVEAKLEGIGEKIKAGTNTYKTVVLDSLTAESDLFLDDAKTKMGGVRVFGSLKLAGGAHYGYEQEAMRQILIHLKGLPINIICSAHTVAKYGRPSEYADNVIIGKQLALRDKVGVKQELHFNEVYEFRKVDSQNKLHYTVTFQDADMCKTAYASKFPSMKAVPITNTDFYSLWLGYMNGKIKL